MNGTALRLRLDVNVWVNHYLPLSKGRRDSAAQGLVRSAFAGHCRLGPVQPVISLAMLDALQDVLMRVNLPESYGLGARNAIEATTTQRIVGAPPYVLFAGGVQPMRDAEDRGVLETAIAARADLLVTNTMDDFSPGARADIDAAILRRGPEGHPDIVQFAHPSLTDGLVIASVFAARSWLIDAVQPLDGLLGRFPTAQPGGRPGRLDPRNCLAQSRRSTIRRHDFATHGRMNLVDLIVLAVIAISALLGLSRGLVREMLGLGSWVLAAYAAFLYGPRFQPAAEKALGNADAAGPVAYAAVFLVMLIVLSLLANLVGRMVRFSILGGLDRTLGLVFGTVRGAAVLIAAYILGSLMLPPQNWPPPLRQARSMALLYDGAAWVSALLPQKYRPNVAAPPESPLTNVENLLHATPEGSALGPPPSRN